MQGDENISISTELWTAPQGWLLGLLKKADRMNQTTDRSSLLACLPESPLHPHQGKRKDEMTDGLQCTIIQTTGTPEYPLYLSLVTDEISVDLRP